MIVRDMPKTFPAMRETYLITCSAPWASTTAPQLPSGSRTTADLMVSTGDGAASTWFNGDVIDRLHPLLGPRYLVASPVATVYASRGSTAPDRLFVLGVKLQHGDSSAGGDMADYSTGAQTSDATFFGDTGNRTTDQDSWDASISSGALTIMSVPQYYDLRAAKRYLRVLVRAGKSAITTESSADEHARVNAVLTFFGADYVNRDDQPPYVHGKLSPYSSTTTT